MLIRRRSRGAGRGGFSLVELLLVLAIISTIAAIAVPRYANSLARYRAEMAARRIVADVALARNHARTRSASQSIVFSQGDNEYSLPGVPDLKDPGSDYRVVLSEAPYQATLVSVDFGGDAEVVFDGYGFPDTGGRVLVQVGQVQRAVVLDPDSAEAKIE